MVGFDLEVVGLQLNRHMAVAQVVGGAGQVKGRSVFSARGNAQHVLRRGQHPHQRAVFGHQHITTAHHSATRQKHTELTPRAVGRIKATFLAGVPVEGDGAGALHQHAGQATALGHEFGAEDHQNKK